ncbi:short chain dehydrogenase/reductase-like protein [Leptodontidium sp. MPI-SDFR-AT-0119]|nr:short chain dehydrogenase/reductase-like protein [Leptodontidium sp. MPI-SDFR-AT-0119]
MSVEKSRKSVLITGCSPGGIGHALAREFHAKGLHVIATARTKEAIQDLEAMGMSTLGLEVTSKESIAEARMQVEKLTGGKLDILVNNAGRNCTLPALEVDLDDARACFETNLFAIIALTQSFIPLLIASKGLILNIGSVAAIVPYVFGSVYNASKAALHSYSQTLRLELEPFDVRVLVVITGGVQSRIARTERVLSEDSLYLDISGDFQRRVKHSQDGAMATDVYARGVVSEALKPAWRMKKWLWRGNKSFLVWFVDTWLGRWAFDWVLPGMFGLRRLKGIVRGRRT